MCFCFHCFKNFFDVQMFGLWYSKHSSANPHCACFKFLFHHFWWDWSRILCHITGQISRNRSVGYELNLPMYITFFWLRVFFPDTHSFLNQLPGDIHWFQTVFIVFFLIILPLLCNLNCIFSLTLLYFVQFHQTLFTSVSSFFFYFFINFYSCQFIDLLQK